MDYFAKRIIISFGRIMGKAHDATLSLGQLKQLAHMASHIRKDL